MEANLKNRLSDDLKQALRGGDKVRRSVFRLALSAIQNAEIAKRADLENSDVLGIIAKEARQRDDERSRKRERELAVGRERAEEVQQELAHTRSPRKRRLAEELEQNMAQTLQEARRSAANPAKQGSEKAMNLLKKELQEETPPPYLPLSLSHSNT